ncbi:DUF409 domain protein [Aspergillus saccharolyticus JOP 1030-1]|uniref:GPI mannosyltransferase 2 n=1 Tax=Aspergillus saccharolyticus JOP 1030-1 TaxID=1450539 RepID=A0A318ZNY8_9EURO|nr:mannosyltransferase [Aspergillus saccharolyticus JOP 1030-1]PYH48365.1 mannosyltransferase [Aspergillus saccharolyticus JOP 1030-1]
MAWKSRIIDISYPLQSLLAVFVLWKGLLLFLIVLTPGPGYDTSTTLIRWNGDATKATLPAMLKTISIKFTRWDSIYYIISANRGYVFEQEWAFGYGFTRLIHVLANGLQRTTILDYTFNESIVGILLSHGAHGLSTISLYYLICALLPRAQGRRVALLAACLHILSPGGAFLSAPCAESIYALLSFCGSLAFVQSFSLDTSPGSLHDIFLVVAGVLYGLATTCRSNGLLNGIPLFEEAVRLLLLLPSGISYVKLRRLLAVGLAGLCTGLGFVLPQYIAYQEFCIVSDDHEPRVWCRRMIPSIYSFVQDHYWDNGFLRYWTLSNIPLFVLAAPMLTILVASGRQAVTKELRELATSRVSAEMQDTRQAQLTDRLLRSLAVPQVVLAVLIFLKHHVQIVTRVSSGYPIWYIWVACLLLQTHSEKEGRRDWKGKIIVKYMVGYAMIQGVLFASFLPPA